MICENRSPSCPSSDSELRPGEELHRIGRHRPRRDHEQVRNLRRAHDAERGHVARQVVRQPARVVDAERLVQRRMAHVGVDQQHRAPGLRAVDRERERRRRLAVALRGARHHERSSARRRASRTAAPCAPSDRPRRTSSARRRAPSAPATCPSATLGAASSAPRPAPGAASAAPCPPACGSCRRDARGRTRARRRRSVRAASR